MKRLRDLFERHLLRTLLKTIDNTFQANSFKQLSTLSKNRLPKIFLKEHFQDVFRSNH